MSLTQTDLLGIKNIIRDEVRSALVPVEQKLDVLTGKVEALENDVKEIVLTAKEAGVTLPRN